MGCIKEKDTGEDKGGNREEGEQQSKGSKSLEKQRTAGNRAMEMEEKGNEGNIRGLKEGVIGQKRDKK